MGSLLSQDELHAAIIVSSALKYLLRLSLIPAVRLPTSVPECGTSILGSSLDKSSPTKSSKTTRTPLLFILANPPGIKNPSLILCAPNLQPSNQRQEPGKYHNFVSGKAATLSATAPLIIPARSSTLCVT